MTNRWCLVAVAVMLVLAGCSGDGGSDDPAGTVSLENAAELERTVSPNETAKIEATTRDGDVDHVNVSYTVFDRQNDTVRSATERMETVGDAHSYTISGYPAGYRVVYEVRAYFEDDPQDTASAGYTVNYVESTSHPSNDHTEAVRSQIGIRLYTLEGVRNVTVNYRRVPESVGEVTYGSTTIEDLQSTNLTATVTNDRMGSGKKDVTVEYNVTVNYGPANESLSSTSPIDSYEYQDNGKALLFVPVKFGNDSRAADITGELQPKAENVTSFYEFNSRGKVHLTREWLFNSSDEPYFVLPNDPSKYVDPGGSYNHSDIVCDAVEESESGRAIFHEYRSVVFVTSEYDGEWMRPYTLNPATNCMGSTPPILVSADHPYGTYAHEVGHALFHWGDYYGGSDAQGQIHQFGIMGEGERRTPTPSQVSAFHRLQEGWTSKDRVTPLQIHGGQYGTDVKYAADGGKAVVYDQLNVGSMIDKWVIEARSSRNAPTRHSPPSPTRAALSTVPGR